MQDLRAAIDERLRNPPPFPQDRFAGRGIVICAGGQRYFTCAWVLISILRRVHQTKLPIQVWHLGRSEMSEAMQLLLEEQGVEVVNAETVLHRHPATIAGAWPLKPYAIAHSRFREVIFLDADTVPLVDPAVMFDWEPYRQPGLLLWPDVIDLRERQSDLEASRPRTAKLHERRIRRDCYRQGARLERPRYRPSCSTSTGASPTNICMATRIRSCSPPLLTGASQAGDRASTVRGRRRPDSARPRRRSLPATPHRLEMEAVRREPALRCAGACAALRSGHRRAAPSLERAFSMPPERSERARAEEAKLIGQKHFTYETSHNIRRLELLRAGAVGEGRTDLEQHWAVIERDGDLVLQLFSGSRLVVELLPQPDGSWRGDLDRRSRIRRAS